MHRPNLISIPSLVRVKPGALARTGLYLEREQRQRIAVLASEGLPIELETTLRSSLAERNRTLACWTTVSDNSFESATTIFRDLPLPVDAIVGLGGGKALDVAKYVGYLARLPCYAIPTSLSNDGFCSPQSSLTIEGRRRSLAAALPNGVIIDVEVCQRAPRVLWHSGVGDLAAKLTAVADWKLAFHHAGEPVDDFAALLSDATVFQFLSCPRNDREGMSLLGTALMLNGIAMEVCGSSRPASGSEHLLSHALDATSSRPRLHGLQVGVATYLISQLHQRNSEQIATLFDQTRFWDSIASDPFSRREWMEALRIAPTIKPNYFTVLSLRDWRTDVETLLHEDPRLRDVFVD